MGGKMNPTSKVMIAIGVTLIVLGVLWHFFGSDIPLGKLPGDIKIKKGNSTFYFPVTTCLIISGILSLIGYFLKK